MKVGASCRHSSVHHPSASGGSDSFCNIVGSTSYINEMEISNIAFFHIVNEKKCSIIYSLKKNWDAWRLFWEI